MTAFQGSAKPIDHEGNIEIRQYLLGRLNEQDEERVEIRLMTDPAFVEEFDIVVTEVTDQYAAGEFTGEEREQVEKYFFASAQRRSRLNIALSLREGKAAWANKRLSSRWTARSIAASILLLVGVSYAVISSLTGESELQKGLTVLRTAVHDRRSVQARVTGIDYAPFQQIRGAENKTTEEQLRLAELTLQSALKNDPTPETHHALGQVYLFKGDFDSAINQFEQALPNAQNKSQIYSDLGAAWLEKAKATRQANAKQTSPDNKAAQYELERSLENLNQALAADNKLLEARFNRALVYETLGKTDEAKADWREYLKIDSNGKWAEEARKNLGSLEAGNPRSPA